MATIQELNIIKAIHHEQAEAKKKNRSVELELSGDEEAFKKAIGAMRGAGAWTVVCVVLGFVLTNVLVAIRASSGEYQFDPDLYIGEALLLGLACVAISVLSYHVYRLNLTPRGMLISVILMCAINLLFVRGILPLIALVYCILALIRWSTYKTWFYSVDVDYYIKKGRKNGTKAKK